jgi:sulfur carrier protein ThiS
MTIEAQDHKGASIGFSYSAGHDDRDIKLAIADLAEQLAEDGINAAKFVVRNEGKIIATQKAAAHAGAQP